MKNSKKKRPLPAGVKLHSEKAKKVFDGLRFEVYQWEQKVFDGSTETYETIKRNDSIAVIPVVGETVYIVKESQPHIDHEWLGLIAGGAEDGEDIYIAAKRELEEETGLVFKNLYLVNVHQFMPGIEWFGYLFVATEPIAKKAQALDHGEKIEVMQITFNRLIELVKSKAFGYSPHFIENFIIRNDLKTFFEILKNPKKFEIKN